MFSFAKFLELLIYSPAICIPTPALCEHTTPPPRPWPASDSPLPTSRLNIIRNFSFQSCIVSFSLSTIEDIFELRVPRLQITHGIGVDRYPERNCSQRGSAEVITDDDKKALRREIRVWWQGVAEHMDRLVSFRHLNLLKNH